MAAAPPPSSSSHRLCAVSASQALGTQLGSQSSHSHITTCCNDLDRVLNGGLPRGKVSELSGPPGSGKTAMAMQMAANALLAADRVIWIDTSHPFPTSRLVSMISAGAQPEEDPLSYLPHLQILRAPSLAHLLALFLHPLPSFPPERTALMVVDNIATLFAAAYLPGHEDFNNKKNANRAQSPGGASSPRGKGSPNSKAASPKDTPSARKFAIMGDLMKSFCGFAQKRNLAILILNQMTTKVIPGSGAVLQPAVQGPMWILGLTSRLLIHRNDISPSALSDPASVPLPQLRFVTILKANGIVHDPEITKKKAPVVVLQIQESGINDVELVKNSSPSPSTPMTAATVTVTVGAHDLLSSPVLSPSRQRERPPVRKKRKRGLEAGVIAGSDEEDSDEEWDSGLDDDDGFGAELLTPVDGGVLGGFTKPMATG